MQTVDGLKFIFYMVAIMRSGDDIAPTLSIAAGRYKIACKAFDAYGAVQHELYDEGIYYLGDIEATINLATHLHRDADIEQVMCNSSQCMLKAPITGSARKFDAFGDDDICEYELSEPAKSFDKDQPPIAFDEFIYGHNLSHRVVDNVLFHDRSEDGPKRYFAYHLQSGDVLLLADGGGYDYIVFRNDAVRGARLSDILKLPQSIPDITDIFVGTWRGHMVAVIDGLSFKGRSASVMLEYVESSTDVESMRLWMKNNRGSITISRDDCLKNLLSVSEKFFSGFVNQKIVRVGSESEEGKLLDELIGGKLAGFYDRASIDVVNHETDDSKLISGRRFSIYIK